MYKEGSPTSCDAYDRVTDPVGEDEVGEIWIEGGVPLQGKIQIQGSKNAVLPMMAAAILHEGITCLVGCPQIEDVYAMEQILNSLGVKTAWVEHSLYLDCRNIEKTDISPGDARRMRSTVMLLGALLGRKGKISFSQPGGCVIGKRPIDLHLQTMQAMGAAVWEEEETIYAEMKGQLRAARVTFPFVSVGATENSIIAAVNANGITQLENCAIEPEISHLCRFLQAMDVEMKGIGTSSLWIQGGCSLRDVKYEVPPDRIVAGTYLLAAAATRGKVILENAPVEEMGAVLRIYEKMGGQWNGNGGKLMANAMKLSRPISYVKTECYPGFPTDMQSILMAVLLTVKGNSRIEETIFEDRFRVVSEFQKMGAQIEVKERQASIHGGVSLFPGRLCAQELRGSASLIVAALAVKGESVVSPSRFIERGYENLEKNFSNLGARIRVRE